MPIYQIDYFIGKNLIRQVIKYYPGIICPYKIFIYINIFNVGYNKQKHTLEEALTYVFENIEKAHSENFWKHPYYMQILKLPKS